ncbi:hypothetical protein K440DRAFT_634936, partial [Wilcoxina mikolae CBS 423.85]
KWRKKRVRRLKRKRRKTRARRCDKFQNPLTNESIGSLTVAAASNRLVPYV